MKVKLFRSGSRDNRYATIRIPPQLADKYSLNQSCMVDITENEESGTLIIKKSN
jgi:hypothetical protein